MTRPLRPFRVSTRSPGRWSPSTYLASCALVLGLFTLSIDASAQTVVEGTQDQENVGAAETWVDPTTGARYRWRSPSEPLRQGPWAVPAWVPLALGVLSVGIAGAAIAWFLRSPRERGAP